MNQEPRFTIREENQQFHDENRRLAFIIHAYNQGYQFYQALHKEEYFEARRQLFDNTKKLINRFVINFHGDLKDELIQACNEQAWKSTNKADPYKTTPFTTYLCECLKDTVKSALAEYRIRNMGFSEYIWQRKDDVQIALFELKEKLGRDPTNEEGTKYFNRKEKARAKKIKKEPIKIFPYHIVGIRQLEEGMESVEFIVKYAQGKINQDSPGVFKDSPLELIIENEMKGDIWSVINNGVLTDREKMVMQGVYKEGMTYEEIGKQLTRKDGKTIPLTKGRVEQIHQIAIRKIQTKLQQKYPDIKIKEEPIMKGSKSPKQYQPLAS